MLFRLKFAANRRFTKCLVTILATAILLPLNGQPVSLASGLFAKEEILEITLSGDIKALLKDRVVEDPQYHPIEFSYLDETLGEVKVPVKVRTRGHFRRDRANCNYPPLLLNFSKKKTPANSLFSGQDKLKLVVPCQNDKYIIREFLAYKVYNLVTEMSFRNRLVRIVFNDTEKGKQTDQMYGFILEDEDHMAARNNSTIVKQNRLSPQKTDPDMFLKMAVFQYLIGNTDWSVQYRHNIKLIAADSARGLITVPYDFDHAGIVSAPYAHPAEALQMSSVRERRYRGYCLTDLKKYDSVILMYNDLRDDIYRIYTESELVDEKYRKFVTKFLDEFYDTINDPKACEVAFSYPCRQDGTGNVVIKGLRGN